MADLPAPLSASKLKKFDGCPRAFDLRYLQRKEPVGSASRYIRRGNAVHEAIETALPNYDPESWDKDFTQFRFVQAYNENGGRTEYSLSDEDDQFVSDCLDKAAKFVVRQTPDIVSVEASVPFHDSEIDHDEGFVGYIDVVTSTEVWDWKTGKSEGKNLDETLQGAVYMAGYAAHMGRFPEKIHFIYLKEGKVKTREPSDEMWGIVREKAQNLLTAIDMNQLPAKPDDSRCYWCDHEVHCDASQVGGGGIDWEAYP